MIKKISLLILMQVLSIYLPAQSLSGILDDEWVGPIEFADTQWLIKDGNAQPGPNDWGGYNSVSVDDEGLHLKIYKDGTDWYSAAVKSVNMAEYGTYIFDMYLESPDFIEEIDENITTSTYFYQQIAPYQKEFDVEFAKWGYAPEYNNSEFSIRKSETPNLVHGFTFHTESSMDPNHRRLRSVMSWSEDQTLLRVYRSLTDNSYGPWELVDEIDYNSDYPGFDPTYLSKEEDVMHVRINFWLMGGLDPVNEEEAELVITDYHYIPFVESPSLNGKSQRSNMLFASDFFSPTGNGTWWGESEEILDFIRTDLERNCVYISTRPLDDIAYGNQHFNEMKEFIKMAHIIGLEVYAMPIFDEDNDYYWPANHSDAIDELENKFKLYQLNANDTEKFDGVYFDIKPWKDEVLYTPAKAAGNYTLLNSYVGDYLDLIEEIRTWYTNNIEGGSSSGNSILAFATNREWEKWAQYIYVNEFPNGNISSFLSKGATTIVPHVYEEKDNPNWSANYNYEWFNNNITDFVGGFHSTIALSAYNPYYNSVEEWLADEEIIDRNLTARDFAGSVLFGYGAAKYTNWSYSQSDSFHDTDANESKAFGTREKQMSAILTYPDPVINRLTIKDPPTCNYNVQIISKHGEMLYSKKNTAMIDVGHFKPDIYYLIVNDGSSIRHSTFIKSR